MIRDIERRMDLWPRLSSFLVVSLLCGQLWVGAAPAREVSQTPTEQAYDTAKTNYQANPANPAVACKFASACFDRADNEARDSVRTEVAWEGVQTCRELLRRNPNLAAAHYYLGMNLAEVARTKKLGALHLLREMEKEWKTAIALDEHCDFAGPDRNLGLLYRDAPGWPLSIGSRPRALQHILRAVELDPEYPENHLNLIETRLKWDQTDEARSEAKKWLALLPSERKRFSGAEWQSDWLDWNQRAAKIWGRFGPGMDGGRF
jgi:tetratricopeptide (TPR) repeat protein